MRTVLVPATQARQADTAPFQFTLSTALWGVSAAAVVCAVTRWLGVFPTHSLPPATALVAACILARRRQDPDLAWALFAAAWCWALCDMGVQTTKCFRCIGCPPLPGQINRCLNYMFWSSVALPLSFSLPILWLINQASRHSRSAARKWLILCPLVATFNAGLLAAALGAIVQLVGW